MTGEGTDLSTYEIATEKVSTYDLGMWPQQITIYGNDLYVMGAGSVVKFIQDSLASLGAGFGSALADIIHLRIPAQPRGAYIRWGIDTRH